MDDLCLPAYTPVYPVTKTVRPRQRATAMPEWGIEQRFVRGQNQTSPEWRVKWILRPIEANTLDFFFAERAKAGEWFRWTPPTGTRARFRCDNWTKQVVAYGIWEVEATIREVFSYDLPRIAPNVGALSLTGLPSTFLYNRVFRTNAGSIILTIAFDALASDGNFDGLGSIDSLASVGLFKTRPIYADKGMFQLTGTNTSVLWGRVMPATAGNLALSPKPVTLLYFSLGTDYFVSMFDQVYGWDRDFQVDWWGD